MNLFCAHYGWEKPWNYRKGDPDETSVNFPCIVNQWNWFSLEEVACPWVETGTDVANAEFRNRSGLDGFSSPPYFSILLWMLSSGWQRLSPQWFPNGAANSSITPTASGSYQDVFQLIKWDTKRRVLFDSDGGRSWVPLVSVFSVLCGFEWATSFLASTTVLQTPGQEGRPHSYTNLAGPAGQVRLGTKQSIAKPA